MPELLQYQGRATEKIRRPIWVYAIVALYCLLLLGLLALPALAVISNPPDHEAAMIVGGAVGILLLLGVSLLIVPIRAHRQRPVSRRSLLLPLLGSSICAAALVLAGGLGVAELLKAGDNQFRVPLLLSVGGVWLAWLGFFGFMMRWADPARLGARLYQSVVVGSVLELLVAVPMHVVVRRRTECCAGIATGLAICVGAAIAVISIGPAILMLYHRRWKQVYVPRKQPESR